ncbi:hypothetical protein [Paludisphaera mucosa]|uniref:Uncharacterized protein n=1 Tax=Paludisphaera mucosa TaxID=3030827 RepID=A0ABT6FDC3_9BACT|nr:hypothetical protein [Paludisphaera mucosa]MDG3005549.1 hypothetical protein [Paludisphaera mucosa]
MVGAILELARASRDHSIRQASIAEAEGRIRDGIGRLEWLRSASEDGLTFRNEASVWGRCARLLKIERERASVDTDSTVFGPRLTEGLAAESRDGRHPIDGGRLLSFRERLLSENRWLTLPCVDAGKDEAARRNLLVEATLAFEEGLRELEKNQPVASRVRLADALVLSARAHRLGGDRLRSLQLCEQARETLGATPEWGPPAHRLLALSESWTETVKALRNHAERPRTREAMIHAIDASKGLHAAAPDDIGCRRILDRAFERLGDFEREGGDHDSAEAAMARRRPLWAPRTAEAVIIDDDLREIAEARKGRTGRDAVAASR